MPKLSPVAQEIAELSAILMEVRVITLTNSSGFSFIMNVDQELRIALFDSTRKHFAKALKRFHVKPELLKNDDQIDFDLENQRDDYSVLQGDAMGNEPVLSASPDIDGSTSKSKRK